MELKCTFLQETIRPIGPKSQIIEANSDQALRELDRLICSIDEITPTVERNLLRRHLRPLRWDANILVNQISSMYRGIWTFFIFFSSQ